MNGSKVLLEGNNSSATGAGGPAAALNATLCIWQMEEPLNTGGGYVGPRLSDLTQVFFLSVEYGVLCIV